MRWHWEDIVVSKRLFFAATMALAILTSTSISTMAAISVYMDGWDYIPRVVVAVGNNRDCNLNGFDGPLRRKQSVGVFQQAGSSGVDVCWRRTADPLNSASPLQSVWTRCSSDGDCIIS